MSEKVQTPINKDHFKGKRRDHPKPQKGEQKEVKQEIKEPEQKKVATGLSAKVYSRCLSARCEEIKNPPGSKCQFATRVTISHAGKQVGSTLGLGGKWDEKQALAEFRKFPTRWIEVPPAEGWPESTSVSIMLGSIQVAEAANLSNTGRLSNEAAVELFKSRPDLFVDKGGLDAANKMGLCPPAPVAVSA